MSQFDDAPWLASLKPGDEVAAVTRGYGRATAEVRKVDRITPTTIVVGASKYRKDNGRRVGTASDWTSYYLMKPNDPVVVEALRGQRVRALRMAVEEAARKCDDVGALESALSALTKAPPTP